MGVRPKLRAFRLTTLSVLFASVLSAQVFTGLLTDKDIGRPAQPPFITFLGIAAPGKMATDPSLLPQGPVAEVLFEELRAVTTPGGPAGQVLTSIKTTYDEQGRPIEEIRKEYGGETNTVNRYDGSRLVSRESTLPHSKSPQLKFWNYWTYDQSGKLTEYRRGSGDALQNHETNFKRDQQGRLISFDYRQGAKDELFSHRELRYSADGKTVDVITSYQTGNGTDSTEQTVDDQGHVIKAILHDWDSKTKKLKAPLNVDFRYDQQGRLVEQNTGAHDFEQAGSEHELPPGKISITYDDTKHTKTTSYYGPEGAISSTLTYNSSGAVIGMSVSTAGQSFDTKLQCTYDSHDNWTSCQQVVEEAAVNRVAKEWRRTITYR